MEVAHAVPHGYAQTLDCLNNPDGWDVPGMIADMAEHLRVGNDVPEGQLLAAVDWMTFRLKECRAVLSDTNISDEVATLLAKLKGF